MTCSTPLKPLPASADKKYTNVFVDRMGLVEPDDDRLAGRHSDRDGEQFRSLVANIPGVVYRSECVEPWAMHFISDYVETLTGYRPGEFLESSVTFGQILHPDDHDRANAVVEEALRQRGPYSFEYRIIRADGEIRWISEHGRVISSEAGTPVLIDGVMLDVTEHKTLEEARDRAEEQLRHQALHDALTGLPNRTLVYDRLDRLIVAANRRHTGVSVLFIDLDNFKHVNDSLGHVAGDDLLRRVAERLSGTIRQSDTVGRLGGDEFVVLTEQEETGESGEAVAERILAVFTEPFVIEQLPSVPLLVSASIGVAQHTGETAEELMRNADAALYHAKAKGKGRYATFFAQMHVDARSRLELGLDLREAIEAKQFFLEYQPILDLESLRPVGAEALIRWRHPKRGVVLPADFVPILEESGSIVEVGRWVLQKACMQAAEWQRKGLDLTMSVNISPRQLEDGRLAEALSEALILSGLEPSKLVLELTESCLMHDVQKSVTRLAELKRLGVQVAIDDFGTGYSSLALLQRLPVDIMKIDRCFVSGGEAAHESEAIIRTLMRLGRDLGLVTLAEGIEEDEQLLRLRSERCQVGQGFLFARSLSPEALEDFVVAPLAEVRGST